jgi:putative sigma-54 modulation protein
MDIAIRGHKVDVPESLRAAVAEKVSRLARFLDGMDRAEVQFSEERNPRIAEREICEITVHGHGHIVRARAAAADTLGAVDLVMSKIEHRMERLKGKLLARSHPRHQGPLQSDDRAGAAVDESDGDEAEDAQARIVKTKAFHIKPMTPEEAALQMELLGHDFFFFTNADTEKPAVVYQRTDGYVGLIDAV